MRSSYLALGLAAVILAAPTASFAQTQTQQGAAQGAADGAKVLGPIGAAAGAVVGASTGLVSDIVAPKFRTYVVAQKRPSYVYKTEDGELVAGPELRSVVLPSEGVVYYEAPVEYKLAPNYRYTIVNDTPVIVDTNTYTVVQVL